MYKQILLSIYKTQKCRNVAGAIFFSDRQQATGNSFVVILHYAFFIFHYALFSPAKVQSFTETFNPSPQEYVPSQGKI